eukprot:TRINITY_DN99_c0_g1_i1.p1 TRINITY_DN99_c0_g1~~TRINITY_DN99_c0_g1_i1.p1  ORF type:complete len:919 (+),score=202.04 TRINITY_DN99_c0_g1_i1:40-2796(+)
MSKAKAKEQAPPPDPSGHNVIFTLRFKGTLSEKAGGGGTELSKPYFVFDPTGKKQEKSTPIATTAFEYQHPPITVPITEDVVSSFSSRPMEVSLFTTAEKKGADTLVGRCLVDLTPMLLGESAKIVYNYSKDSPTAPPPGLASLELSVEINEPLLNLELQKRYNPLIISIISASNLPNSDAPFEKLRESYKPVYCQFRFEGIDDGPVVTPALAHAKKLTFSYHKLILAGKMDVARLTEQLNSKPLVVELHDREPAPPQPKPVAVSATPVAAAAPTTTSVASTKGGAGKGAAAAKTAAAPVVEQPPPPPPPEEDPLDVLRAGVQDDVRPYGIATFSLQDMVTRNLKTLTLTSNVIPARVSNPRATAPRYVEAGTELKIQLRMAYPLGGQAIGRLGRMVIIMDYDHPQVRPLFGAVLNLNAKGLNLPPRNVTAHRFTPEQLADPTLDVITGFQLIENGKRMFVLEGQQEGALQALYKMFPKDERTAELHSMYNIDVRFHERLYSEYDTDLKRLRMVKPFAEILAKESAYRRDEMSEECWEALRRLSQIEPCHLLKEIIDRRLLPSVAMLKAIEKKFGDKLNNDDLNGCDQEDGADARKARAMMLMTRDGTHSAVPSLGTSIQLRTGLQQVPAELATTLRAANPKFDESLKVRDQRGPRNIIAENIAKYPGIAEPLERTTDYDKDGVFIYSQQALNSSDLQRKAMREKLATTKNKLYTYSQEYSSLSFPLGDVVTAQKEHSKATKAKFITDRGFVYPAPRDPKEFNTHEKRPTESRVEELRQPWKAGEALGAPPSGAAGSPTGKPRFDTTSKVPAAFSEKEFFKSVHLTGAGLEKDRRAAVEREFTQWEEKLVVDDPSMRLHWRSSQRTVPHATDRPTTLLHDPPQKLGLRPPVALEAPPHSIFVEEPYTGGPSAIKLRDF